MRVLILWMIAPFVFGDYEYKVSQLNYRWWDVASFPVTLHTVGYTKTIRSIDLSVRHGISTKQKNELDTPYRDITGQITDFWSFGIGSHYQISRFKLFGGILYTEYKELGKPDTDFGRYYGIEYKLNNDYSIRLTKDQYYTKHKTGHGNEVTEGIGLAIAYR